MSLEWQDTKMIILEVEQLFNRDDDIRDIRDIRLMQTEIDKHCANSLKDAKELIKEMTMRLALKESEVLAPTEASHSQELDRLIEDKENVTSQVESLRASIDAKKNRMYDLASSSLQCREDMARLAEDSHVSDARISYALSLYGKISNITWDYSTDPSTSSHLTGFVGIDKTQELRRFQISKESSSVEIANELWDLIGSNY